MSKKNLVIVRAGDKSLHPQWLGGERNWDLVVSYYGSHFDRYKDQFDIFHSFKGSKWQGIFDFLNNFKNISNYEYVWLPDDDIFTFTNDINLLFDLCKKFKFTLAQPSLTNFSYYSWGITLQNKDFLARKTNFIEIMAPLIEVKNLNFFIKIFEETISGWGMEWIWSDIAQKNNIFNFGIIDAVPIYHTRPVGFAGHGGSIDPQIERENLLKKYGVSKYEPKIIGYWKKNN